MCVCVSCECHCMSVCACVCVCVFVSFSDRLQIDVVDSVSHSVDVTGCGQGVAVITQPALPCQLRLGPCYCGHVARHEFMIVNMGRRQQTVFAVNNAASVKSSKRPGHVTSLMFTASMSSLLHSFSQHLF